VCVCVCVYMCVYVCVCVYLCGRGGGGAVSECCAQSPHLHDLQSDIITLLLVHFVLD